MANNELVLDINKKSLQHPTVVIRQGDYDLYKINVVITDNGVPIDLSDFSLNFMGTTPGGNKIVDGTNFYTFPGDLQIGKFSYGFPSAAASTKGVYEYAYFQLKSSDGVVSSVDLTVRVLGGVDLTQEEAEDYISVADGVIQTVRDNLTNELSDVTELLSQTQDNVDQLSSDVADYAATAQSYAAQIEGVASDTVSEIQTLSDNTKTSIENTANDARDEINQIATDTKEYIDDLVPTLDGYAKDDDVVHKTGNETISDVKTFEETIIGAVSGNAGSADRLATAHTINGVAFDGSEDIELPLVDDDDLVHKTGDETISDTKTFENLITQNDVNDLVIKKQITPIYSNTEHPFNIDTATGGFPTQSDVNISFAVTFDNTVPFGTTPSGSGSLAILKHSVVVPNATYVQEWFDLSANRTFTRTGVFASGLIWGPWVDKYVTTEANNTWTGNNSFSGLNTYNGVTDTPLQTLNLLNGVTGTISYKIKSGMITLGFENVNFNSYDNVSNFEVFAIIPNISNLGRLIRFRTPYKNGYITLTINQNGTIYLANVNNQTIDNTFTIYETISFVI